MSIGLTLRIALTLAGAGVLLPICVASQEAIRQTVQQAETVMAVASSGSSPFANHFPVVPLKRKSAWGFTERIRRMHQHSSHADAVFVGGTHPPAIPQVLNFSPTSYVGTFRAVSAVACIWRRGPPSLSFAFIT